MKTFEFTKTDIEAIKRKDFNYLNNKGVDAYLSEDYDIAREYYKLAGTMGCIESISNLGYYYMYHANPLNRNKAIAYFLVAANFNSVEALYKLGDIYRNGIGVEKDIELGLYYFKEAFNVVDKNSDKIDYRNYPSLFFAIAKEYMRGGAYKENLNVAYFHLCNAMEGYEYSINNGLTYYEEAYNACSKLFNSKIFNGIREDVNNTLERSNLEEDDIDE